MSESSSLSIPIIIINWKGIDDTLECMNSVMQLTHPHYQVYLVDNHSDDGSVEILKEHYQSNPKVRLIFNQKNLGFTKANNEVFKLILKKDRIPNFVALLNNDTVVDPNWLSSLIATANKHNASIIASKMIDYYDRVKMDNAGHLMLNTGEILPIGHGELISRHNKVHENMGACAGACLYSTDMLKKIGLFDEYFTTGYEDAELGVRATLAGFKCMYAPSAIVYHKMGQSIKKVFNYDYAVAIQKNVLYAYLKLTPRVNLLLNFPFVFIRYLSILTVQMFFRRPVHIRIIFSSIKEILFKDFSKLKLARQNYKSFSKLSSLEVQKKQTFFVTNNLKRFYYYFIQKKQSAFDAYGKKEFI